ncbi:MAG: DUF2452 domain-containing protein [Crocinitomicaceae bacterium]|nr:DUF2452 domain-containing protein [Crocinitomicaceae bacterium]
MTDEKANEKKKQFINPIDPDKITESPNSIEYPHHLGSAIVKPEDKGRIKGNAMAAMESQTDMQLHQIYEQMQLLAEQARKIEKRKEVSEIIYAAEMRFQPLINHVYHLYQRENGTHILSLIPPEQTQFSKNMSNWEIIASVKLLADHTWEILG